jgi:amino acid transporter
MSKHPALLRALGRWDLVFITVNSTVGAGILGLPGKVYALLGPYSVFTCAAGGVLMGLVAVCYAEAGSRFQGTGGSYLYARAAFGTATGFFTGWLAIVTRLLAYAGIMNLLIGYASGILPAIGYPAWRIVAITAISWGLGGVIYVGIALSAAANRTFTLLKLALLVGFVCVGAIWAFPVHVGPLPPPAPAANWGHALVLMMFGLIGMDSTVVNGQEMRDPRRDVPFGLGVGMLIVVVLYAAILLVCAATVPHLAQSARPLFDGAVAMLGKPAGVAVVIGAVISMSGTLFTILLIGPRLIFALADGGQLPRYLAGIHPRFSTPGHAILLHTAAAWLLAVVSSFLGALTASTLTRLMLYALTAASLVMLRRRRISEQPKPLELPGGEAIAVAATGLCVWLMFQSDRAAWLAALGCIGVGVLTLGAGGLHGQFLRKSKEQ